MSLARETVHHTLILTTAQVARSGFSIISLLFYTRILKQDEFALIPVVMILGELCYTFSSLGMDLSVVRKMPALLETDRESALSLARSYIWGTILISIVFCAIIILLSRPITLYLLKDVEKESLIPFFIPIIATRVWVLILSFIMRGTRQFVQLSTLMFSTSVLAPLLIITCYYFWNVKGMLLGMALGRVPPCLIATWLQRDVIFGKVSWKAMKNNIHDSWPFYAESYVMYGFRFADQWVVGLFLTPYDLAVYYVPRLFFDRIMMLVDSPHSVLMSTLSQASAKGMDAVKSGLAKANRAHIYLFVPLSVLLIASSYYIVDLLAGPRYHAGTVPFIILAVFYLIKATICPLSLGVIVLGKPHQRLQSVIVQTVTLLLALPILTYAFQLNGVAASRVAGAAAMAIVSWYILRRIVHVPTDIKALNSILFPCLLLLLVGGGPQFFFYHRLIVPVYLIIGAVIYICIFLTNISADELKTLAQILPSKLQWLVVAANRLQSILKKPTTNQSLPSNK